MHQRATALASASALALSLAAAVGLTTPAGATDDHGRTAPSSAVARQTLTEAQAAVSGAAGRPTRDVTLALRDLWASRSELSGADARSADRILARPTDPGDDDYYGPGVTVEVDCGAHVCVHWVESGENAATPQYAADVLETVEAVHEVYVDAGYKAPLPDEGQGGSALTDVYLAEISDYAYGYCTTDMTEYNPDDYAVYAYCVLDDDYAPEEFPTNTPFENMQVTAAHEYFHAVQGAYDWSEDAWFMEGTATWAEDELFDDVDDNAGYLDFGQLGDPARSNLDNSEGPRVPLDADRGLNVYGNWIFFRHVTEVLPGEEGGLPLIMRDIWENADSTNGAANDEYSLQAIHTALAADGFPFRAMYTDFAVVNRDPQAHYDEGVALDYPTPPLAFKPVTLTPSKPRTTWGSLLQDHLTNDTTRFRPGTKMTKPSWRLKLEVDMAPTKRGSVAMVTVFFQDGPTGVKQIDLNAQGDGSTKVPFSRGKVAYVELTMINASERTTCWTGHQYSCYGTPTDDNLTARLRGLASR